MKSRHLSFVGTSRHLSIMGGKPLANNRTLAFYDIQNNSNLELHCHLLGGGLREELMAMKISDLKKRAQALHATGDQLAEAKAKRGKEPVIDLIIKLSPPESEAALLRQELSALKIEEVEKRAMAAGVPANEIAEAEDDADGDDKLLKEALINITVPRELATAGSSGEQPRKDSLDPVTAPPEAPAIDVMMQPQPDDSWVAVNPLGDDEAPSPAPAPLVSDVASVVSEPSMGLLNGEKALEVLNKDMDAAKKSAGGQVGGGTVVPAQLLADAYALPATSVADRRRALRANQCDVDIHAIAAGVEQQAQMAYDARGAQTVFLVGGTGAGKSTTTNWLMGKTIEERKVPTGKDKKGRVRYETVLETVGDNLKDCEIGHGTNSKTLDIKAFHHEASRLTFCDAPGFEDTAGATVDAVNAISILNTVRLSASVRIILLIDADGLPGNPRGAAMRMLIDQLKLVKRFLRNPEDIQSLVVLFTRCECDASKISATIARALERDDLEDDSEVQALLQHTIDQLDEHENMMLLRPVQESPDALIRLLDESTPILDVTGALGTPLTSGAVDQIESACKSANLRIEQQLRDHESLGGCLSKDLHALQLLSDLLRDVDGVTHSYRASCESVQAFINTACEDASHALEEAQYHRARSAIERLDGFATRGDDEPGVADFIGDSDDSAESDLIDKLNAITAAKVDTICNLPASDVLCRLNELNDLQLNLRKFLLGDNIHCYTTAKESIRQHVVDKTERAASLLDLADATRAEELSSILSDIKGINVACASHDIRDLPQYSNLTKELENMICAAHDRAEELIPKLQDQFASLVNISSGDGKATLEQSIRSVLQPLRTAKTHLSDHLTDTSNIDACEQLMADATEAVYADVDKFTADQDYCKVADFMRVTEMIQRLGCSCSSTARIAKKKEDITSGVARLIAEVSDQLAIDATTPVSLLPASPVTVASDMDELFALRGHAKQLGATLDALVAALGSLGNVISPESMTCFADQYNESCNALDCITQWLCSHVSNSFTDPQAVVDGITHLADLFHHLHQHITAQGPRVGIVARVWSDKDSMWSGLESKFKSSIAQALELSSDVQKLWKKEKQASGHLTIELDLPKINLLQEKLILLLDYSSKLRVMNCPGFVLSDAVQTLPRDVPAAQIQLQQVKQQQQLLQPMQLDETRIRMDQLEKEAKQLAHDQEAKGKQDEAMQPGTAVDVNGEVGIYVSWKRNRGFSSLMSANTHCIAFGGVSRQVYLNPKTGVKPSWTVDYRATLPDEHSILSEQLQRLEQQLLDEGHSTKKSPNNSVYEAQPDPEPEPEAAQVNAFESLRAQVNEACDKVPTNLQAHVCRKLCEDGKGRLTDDGCRLPDNAFKHLKIELNTLKQCVAVDPIIAEWRSEEDLTFQAAYDELLQATRDFLRRQVDCFRKAVKADDIPSAEQAKSMVEHMVQLGAHLDSADAEYKRMRDELSDKLKLFVTRAMDLFKQREFEKLAKIMEGMQSVAGVQEQQDFITARAEISKELETMFTATFDILQPAAASKKCRLDVGHVTTVKSNMKIIQAAEPLAGILEQGRYDHWVSTLNNLCLKLCKKLRGKGFAMLKRWNFVGFAECRDQLELYLGCPLHGDAQALDPSGSEYGGSEYGDSDDDFAVAGAGPVIPEVNEHPVGLLIEDMNRRYDRAVKLVESQLAEYVESSNTTNIDKILTGLENAEEDADDFEDDELNGCLERCQETLKAVVHDRFEDVKTNLKDRDIKQAHSNLTVLKRLTRSVFVKEWAEDLGGDDGIDSLREELSFLKGQMFKHAFLIGDPVKVKTGLTGFNDVDPMMFERERSAFMDTVQQKGHQKCVDLSSATCDPAQIRTCHEFVTGLNRYNNILEEIVGEEIVELVEMRSDIMKWLVYVVHRAGENTRAAIQRGDEDQRLLLCAQMQAAAKVLDDEEIRDVMQTCDARLTADCVEAVEAAKKVAEGFDEILAQMAEAYALVCGIEHTDPSFEADELDSRLDFLLKHQDALQGTVSMDNEVSFQGACRHIHRQVIQRAVTDSATALAAAEYKAVANTLVCLSKLFDMTHDKIGTKANTEYDKLVGEITRTLQVMTDSVFKQFLLAMKTGKFQTLNEQMETLRAAAEHLEPVLPMLFSEYGEGRVVKQMIDHTTKAKDRSLNLIRSAGAVSATDVSCCLLEMYSVPCQVSNREVEEHARESMQEVLNECVTRSKRKGSEKFDFVELGKQLETADPSKYGGLGGEITDKFSQFQEHRIGKFAAATAKANPTYCINEIAAQNGMSFDEKSELTRRWNEYVKVYDRLCKDQFFTRDLKRLADDIKSRAGGHNLEKVVAGICAVWSLASCPAGNSAMMQPHCVQVLAIFRLLGLEKGVAPADVGLERGKRLARNLGKSFLPASLNQLLQASNLTESHLIQVKTGEGKSVLLGVLATLLAVMGCEVDCVCYSQYLSRRDKAAFSKVFEAFGVEDMVKYDTFHQLAEQRINCNGNVRNLTDEALGVKKGGRKETAADDGETPKILLIDEVDVFFSEEFYGETYDPITTFNTPEVEEIQRYIWEHRNETGGLAATVKSLDAYKRLLATYPDLKKVIDGHCDCMVTDVHKVVSNKLTMPYHVVAPAVGGTGEGDSKMHMEPEPEPEPEFYEPEPEPEAVATAGSGTLKIGYEDQDLVSTNVFINYETTFLYMKEAAAGKAMDVEGALGLRIPCGHFSYAEMARTGKGNPYTYILGVTGTLECLGEYEKKIIKDDFGIKAQSVTPSIYGETRLDFTPSRDVVIEKDQEQHWQKIAHQIRTHTGNAGAVLVFFETEQKIAAFKASHHAEGIENLHVVTTATDNIDFYVKQATRSGHTTLFSRIHGRGLDFVCHDPAVEKDGGVHVVQTFLSVEMSEEIQIRGRTSRQDKRGSYMKVLLVSDLSKGVEVDEETEETTVAGFDVSEEDLAEQPLPPNKTMYEFLHAKRLVYNDARAAMRAEKVRSALAMHQSSQAYVEALRTGNRTKMLDYLNKNSCCEGLTLSVDVCFLMDATCSMGPHIQNAKDTITSIADQVKAAFPGVAVRFAFIAYRDHADQMGGNDSNHFEEFDFSDDVPALKTFIGGVEAIGGGDAPEDIAGGLHKTLALPWCASTRCLILVADAPCHGSKFHSCGGSYPGGDPNGLDPLAQMVLLREKAINFAFYSANSTTDQMGRMFADAYRGGHYEMEIKKLGDAAAFQTQAVGTITKSIRVGRA